MMEVLQSALSASPYLAMDGHGAFIWPAYAISFLALIFLVWRSYSFCRSAERKLRAAETNQSV